MRQTIVLASIISLSAILPAWATPCGTHIATIERRLETSGASKVTGEPSNPKAESGSKKAVEQAPASVNATTVPSADKIQKARGFIDEAKTKDQAGDQTGCEASMEQATQLIGALP